MYMRTIQYYIKNITFTIKKIMTYTMVKKTPFMYPTTRYLNVVKKGYKDCKLDIKYLKKAL